MEVIKCLNSFFSKTPITKDEIPVCTGEKILRRSYTSSADKFAVEYYAVKREGDTQMLAIIKSPNGHVYAFKRKCWINSKRWKEVLDALDKLELKELPDQETYFQRQKSAMAQRDAEKAAATNEDKLNEFNKNRIEISFKDEQPNPDPERKSVEDRFKKQETHYDENALKATWKKTIESLVDSYNMYKKMRVMLRPVSTRFEIDQQIHKMFTTTAMGVTMMYETAIDASVVTKFNRFDNPEEE